MRLAPSLAAVDVVLELLIALMAISWSPSSHRQVEVAGRCLRPNPDEGICGCIRGSGCSRAVVRRSRRIASERAAVLSKAAGRIAQRYVDAGIRSANAIGVERALQRRRIAREHVRGIGPVCDQMRAQLAVAIEMQAHV